ncbi:MAG: ankyrin repeat domain-containing protein, partial [Acidobacteriota bacterium]
LLLTAARSGLAADDPGDALRRAASAGDLAKVKELLAAGVDVNAANAYGGTALAFACDKGQAAVVDLLLERGANVNATDTFYGNTPLAWAAIHGHAGIAKSLLEKGAQGEAQALMAAAEEGHGSVVKMILDRGKVGSEALSDALLIASQSQQPQVSAILEAAGAKPWVPVAVDPAVLKSYEGTYDGALNGEDFSLTAAASDGKLTLATDGQTFTFAALDPVTFKAEGIPGLKVVFLVEAGKVRGLNLLQGETTTPLTRKEAP